MRKIAVGILAVALAARLLVGLISANSVSEMETKIRKDLEAAVAKAEPIELEASDGSSVESVSANSVLKKVHGNDWIQSFTIDKTKTGSKEELDAAAQAELKRLGTFSKHEAKTHSFCVDNLRASGHMRFRDSNNTNVSTESNYLTDETFTTKGINDDKALKKCLELCYFEGKDTAGFNSYPLYITPQIQLFFDNIYLSEKDFFYIYYNEELRTVLGVLDKLKPNNFYDEYLLYRSRILLNQYSEDEIFHFLESHYDAESQLFFEKSKGDTLMNKLTATLDCAILCDEADIKMPHLEEVKNKLSSLLEDDKFYPEVKSLGECYTAVLKEGGTVLKIIYYITITEPETKLSEKISHRKAWFKNVADVMLDNLSTSDSVLSLFAINDIIRFNKFFGIGLNKIPEYCRELYKKINFYNVGYEGEVYCHDSQYIREFADLSIYCKLDGQFKGFLKKYLSNNVKTGFKKFVQTNLDPGDTYYGVLLSKKYYMPVDKEKIANMALVWLREFIADKQSNVSGNQQGKFALQILNELEVSPPDDIKKSLHDSIISKLGDNKYKAVREEKMKRLLLHEMRILLDMKEIFEETRNGKYFVPSWIMDMVDDDLSLANYNIADDLINVIKYVDEENLIFADDSNTTRNMKYKEALIKKLHNETETKGMNSGENETIVQKYYQFNSIGKVLGFELKFSKDIENISISNLSTAFYITVLR